VGAVVAGLCALALAGHHLASFVGGDASAASRASRTTALRAEGGDGGGGGDEKLPYLTKRGNVDTIKFGDYINNGDKSWRSKSEHEKYRPIVTHDWDKKQQDWVQKGSREKHIRTRKEAPVRTTFDEKSMKDDGRDKYGMKISRKEAPKGLDPYRAEWTPGAGLPQPQKKQPPVRVHPHNTATSKTPWRVDAPIEVSLMAPPKKRVVKPVPVMPSFDHGIAPARSSARSAEADDVGRSATSVPTQERELKRAKVGPAPPSFEEAVALRVGSEGAAAAPQRTKLASSSTSLAGGLPRLNLYQLGPDQIGEYMQELGRPFSLGAQVHSLLHEKGVATFDDMKSLPQELRSELAVKAAIGFDDWSVLARRESKDGTVKVAYGVPGGHAIESVLMRYEDGRRTACISSQVGCAMNCVFCATGQMGFKRHLTSAEIFEQVARFGAELKRAGERLSSVVLLGMGEPLANLDNVLVAIGRMHEELGIGRRHITVSTVGLVPQIRRLAKEKLPITLAISLHAATDAERSKLLPVNTRYPIAELMEAARDYRTATGRRVSFEWTLIDGENDGVAQARRLGEVISKGAPGSHVNLIPLNPTGGYGGQPPKRQVVQRFVDVLAEYGVEATVRVRRGIDIDAGCGQLAERATAEYEANRRASAVAADDWSEEESKLVVTALPR